MSTGLRLIRIRLQKFKWGDEAKVISTKSPPFGDVPRLQYKNGKGQPVPSGEAFAEIV